MREVLFSSKSGVWATPQDLFDQLDREFGFSLDVCANPGNAKVARFFEGDTGLDQSWEGHVCFMNPPYGREIVKWVRKAALEATIRSAVVVALLPARTDTRWFWESILAPGRAEIRLIRGRLKFSNHKRGAPFPSMIVIFR